MVSTCEIVTYRDDDVQSLMTIVMNGVDGGHYTRNNEREVTH